MARVEKGIWADLAVTGASFACHVTPRARQPGISRSDDGFRISVTAAPEDGRANEAVRAALANALGVAKTRLVLVSGGSARDKLFRLE